MKEKQPKPQLDRIEQAGTRRDHADKGTPTWQ
jgi:hypothetical protein